MKAGKFTSIYRLHNRSGNSELITWKKPRLRSWPTGIVTQNKPPHNCRNSHPLQKNNIKASKTPHVEQEQTVSIKVQKDPQLSLLRISSVGRRRRRSVAFHLCEGIVLENAEQSRVQSGGEGAGVTRDDRRSRMRPHHMMRANRLEQTFVINHISWTTSQHPHESKTHRNIFFCCLRIVGLRHSVLLCHFVFCYTKAAREFRGVSHRVAPVLLHI